MTSVGNIAMLPAKVDRSPPLQRGLMNIHLQNFQLQSNKSLKDWSLGKIVLLKSILKKKLHLEPRWVAGYSIRFYGRRRLCSEVQPLTLFSTKFIQQFLTERYPFLCLLVKSATPFTYLFQNTASPLISVKMHGLFNMNKSLNQEVLVSFTSIKSVCQSLFHLWFFYRPK